MYIRGRAELNRQYERNALGCGNTGSDSTVEKNGIKKLFNCTGTGVTDTSSYTQRVNLNLPKDTVTEGVHRLLTV